MTGYGGVPMRAGRDKTLSPSALRLLIVIAFHDRLGINGRHCYAPEQMLASETGIDAKHVTRYIRELIDIGYLEVMPNPPDRRRRMYRVIQDEEVEEPTNPGGENSTSDPEVPTSAGGENWPGDAEIPTTTGGYDKSDHPKKSARAGGYQAEIPTSTNSQTVDFKGVSRPKKTLKGSSKRNTVETAPIGGERRDNTPASGPAATSNVRQVDRARQTASPQDGPLVAHRDDRASRGSGHQGQLMLPFHGEKPAAQKRAGVDTQYWARWLVEIGAYPDMGQAFTALIDQIDEIKSKHGVGDDRARKMLDNRLRSRRARRRDRASNVPETTAPTPAEKQAGGSVP